MRGRLPLLLLAAALVLVGALAWAIELRPALRPRAERLGALPERLGAWRGRELPLEENVESMLEATYNVQRAYAHPLGAAVWLYVGYYGTERGGYPEHTPRTCYRAHGWELGALRVVRTPGGARANEMVARREERERLVHFWYRSHRSARLLGRVEVALDHALGRLGSGRADGALVRISTPIPDGDREVARSRLVDFARRLEPALAEHWPEERRAP